MGKPDYYRYHLELVSHGQTVFPDQQTLINYVADFLSEEYKDFILRSMVVCSSTMDDIERYTQREKSEPKLVHMYVRTYIIRKFAQMDTLGNRLKAKLRRQSWPLDICFDAKSNTEMFAYVLKRIGQGDKVASVFSSSYTYTIKEGKKLVRTHI